MTHVLASCSPLQIKCSSPFGKDSPCQSCRKNGVDCAFSDRQKTGPKAKGATGEPGSPGVRSVTQGGRASRTVQEPARAASGRARPSTRLTSGHEAENTGSIFALGVSEGLASSWTAAYWNLAVRNSDTAQTSVAGATANNGDAHKKLRADMHAIGDTLTVRWVFH
ncbi:unnamed protein product, partial [Ectocarpus fasciculatus]